MTCIRQPTSKWSWRTF